MAGGLPDVARLLAEAPQAGRGPRQPLQAASTAAFLLLNDDGDLDNAYLSC